MVWKFSKKSKTKQKHVPHLVVCSTIQHCGYLQKPPLLLTFPLSLLLNQPPQKFCPVKNNDDDMVHIWYKELTIRMSKVKTFFKYAYPVKRYSVFTPFCTIFSNKMVENWTFKTLYLLSRHISKMFSLLTSLWWLLSETIIRYPFILRTKFGEKFEKTFSYQKCQNLKNKKHTFFWNGEFYIV